MNRTPLDYLDLDIWLVARRGDAGFFAFTMAEPFFRMEVCHLKALEKRCARELAMYAMTDGHDATFVVEAVLLPTGRPTPRFARSIPMDEGCHVAGRLLVTDVLDGSGRSILPEFAIPAGGRAAA